MKSKKLIIAIIVVAVTVLTSFYIFSGGKKESIKLETTTINRGTITNNVTATGTVEPIDKLDVGTQVSGVIDKLYVDFNSTVKKGQLLAELDKSTLRARLLQSQANLEAAQNELTYQEQNYNRTKKLHETSMVSDVDYETALYKYNNAKTSADRLKSELEQAQVNLSYASIYSPIDGVILARNVEEGQTVAASFNTPTLFSIARDLTKMQVEANVDEADIGQVKVNQRVTFTVDAFPDDKFDGVVTQIRLNPTVSSNVVTYKVIVEAPNPDLKLMPGLTASISIITKEAKDVLVVSAKALNFKPDQTVIEKFAPKPDFEKNDEENDSREFKDGMPSSPNAMNGETEFKLKKGEGMVWVKRGETIEPRMIQTGLADGTITEVKEGLHEGDSVVTASTKLNLASASTTQNRSPFMPQPPQRKRNN